MALLPIHVAAHEGDVDALRRELGTNVSPDVATAHGLMRPVHYVVKGSLGAKFSFGVRATADDLARDTEKRVACIHLLAAAGANMNAVETPTGSARTALMLAALEGNPTLLAALLDAGSDVNSSLGSGWTPLHDVMCGRGSRKNAEECARLLINAGAKSGNMRTSWQWILQSGKPRLYPMLLRAGAALPAVTALRTDDTYLRKVIAAGGFRAYQCNHLNALVASFAPKLPRRLPQEMVRRVVKYAFHVGYY